MVSTKVLVVILIIAIIVTILEIPRYIRMKCGSVESFDKTRSIMDRKSRANSRVVVTLSTIPDRIEHLGPTLSSLLDQTLRIDEIALNVPYVSRKGVPYEIPEWLRGLRNVTLHRVDEDIGPATKILPTLRREDNGTLVIAVDDDVIYHSKTVEVLVQEHLKRQCAVTNYGIKLEKGKLPSNVGRVAGFVRSGRRVDLLQGFSGFLVTPEMFPPEVYDLESGPPEAISVDDVWLSGWLMRNGVSIRTPSFTFMHLPLVNLGKMRSTTALGKGENIGFERDLKVIEWFGF